MKALTQILKIPTKFWENLKKNMQIKEKAKVNWRIIWGLESKRIWKQKVHERNTLNSKAVVSQNLVSSDTLWHIRRQTLQLLEIPLPQNTEQLLSSNIRTVCSFLMFLQKMPYDHFL